MRQGVSDALEPIQQLLFQPTNRMKGDFSTHIPENMTLFVVEDIFYDPLALIEHIRYHTSYGLRPQTHEKTPMCKTLPLTLHIVISGLGKRFLKNA